MQEALFVWRPKKDEQVTWEQTLAIPLTVIEVNLGTEIAVVEGKGPEHPELRCPIADARGECHDW